MKDVADLRKLVEFIFSNQVIDTAEMTAPNSSVPACLQTRDFRRSLQKVLSTKQKILLCKCETFFDSIYDKMFISHDNYLASIMFVCKLEYSYCQNIFEGFISMCAVLENLSKGTLAKTGMNFCALNPDIAMVFYDSIVKKLFRKRGGFRRLVEHIRGHRYLDLDIPDAPTTDNSDGAKTLAIEISKESFDPSIYNASQVKAGYFMGQKVLQTTKVKLPTLLSKRELIEKLVAHRRNEIVKAAEVKGRIEVAVKLDTLEEIDQGCSNSGSETNHVPRQKEDIARYESIVLAVTRYNRSNSSGLVRSDNSIQKKADRILEQLKDGIESLIEVLDEYDEE